MVNAPIEIRQGESLVRFTFVFKQADGTPYSLAGATAELEVRVGAGAAVVLRLTSADGGLVIDEDGGTIDFDADQAGPDVTAAIAALSYQYQLAVTLAGNDRRITHGGAFRVVAPIVVYTP